VASPLIGVTGLQGAYREHIRALESLGAQVRTVRLPDDLRGLDGLVIPGGESTTMWMLMDRMKLLEPLREALRNGLPTLGTCAGMILLAERVSDAMEGQRGLEVMDIGVRRNAYGSQAESFEADIELELDLDGDPEPFPGVFIRAPILEDPGTAQVIATHNGKPVGVRQDNFMALSFHPELSGDLRLHQEFLRIVEAYRKERDG
jgi:5'-phosphate synthase pdxT subunit